MEEKGSAAGSPSTTVPSLGTSSISIATPRDKAADSSMVSPNLSPVPKEPASEQEKSSSSLEGLVFVESPVSVSKVTTKSPGKEIAAVHGADGGSGRRDTDQQHQKQRDTEPVVANLQVLVDWLLKERNIDFPAIRRMEVDDGADGGVASKKVSECLAGLRALAKTGVTSIDKKLLRKICGAQTAACENIEKQKTLSICPVCNKSVGPGHCCLKCKKNIHGFCGVADPLKSGMERHGQPLNCKACFPDKCNAKSDDKRKKHTDKVGVSTEDASSPLHSSQGSPPGLPPPPVGRFQDNQEFNNDTSTGFGDGGNDDDSEERGYEDRVLAGDQGAEKICAHGVGDRQGDDGEETDKRKEHTDKVGVSTASPSGDSSCNSGDSIQGSGGAQVAMMRASALVPCRGLSNFGNTCYINSTVQMLFTDTAFMNLLQQCIKSLPKMRKGDTEEEGMLRLVLKQTRSGDVDDEGVSLIEKPKQGTLVNALVALYNHYSDTSSNQAQVDLSLQTLRQSFIALKPAYDNWDQQDGHEFLLLFFDLLVDDMQPSKDASLINYQALTKKHFEMQSQYFRKCTHCNFERYVAENTTLPHHLIDTLSSLYCGISNNTILLCLLYSVEKGPQCIDMTCTFGVPEQPRATVQSCLDHYLIGGPVDDYFCEHCLVRGGKATTGVRLLNT